MNTLVLFFACAWVSVGLVTAQNADCTMELERTECAFSSFNPSELGSDVGDCVVPIQLWINTGETSDMSCKKLNLSVLQTKFNFKEQFTFSGNFSRSFNESTKIHNVRFSISGKKLVEMHQIRHQFSDSKNPKVEFFYKPIDESVACSAGDYCRTKKRRTPSLEIRLDKAPDVMFQVTKALPAKNSNDVKLKTFASMDVARISNASGDLVVEVGVEDNDNQTNENFEYSAIKSFEVTFEATVKFSDKSPAAESIADGEKDFHLIEAGSGNCKNVTWCVEEVNKLAINREKVKNRINVTGLYSAVLELYIHNNMSDQPSESYAQVEVTFSALASSGTTNPQKVMKNHTLTVVFLQKIRKAVTGLSVASYKATSINSKGMGVLTKVVMTVIDYLWKLLESKALHI